MNDIKSPQWNRLIVWGLVTILSGFFLWVIWFNLDEYRLRLFLWYREYKFLVWIIGIGVTIGGLYLLGTTGCPHCRERIPKGANVCSHCGRDLLEKQS